MNYVSAHWWKWWPGLAVVTALIPAAFALPNAARGCTIAVVSGRATADGRPLLWKNRDTDSRQNVVSSFTDGKYRLLAVIDAGTSETVWMGMNEAGFCIANSLSLDLPGGSLQGRGNGRFMKLALQGCESIADFEKLLWETNQTGRRTRANFGVIDAHGGAAMFEAGHQTFVKFDANNPQTAPLGYLVRSNFSMTVTGAKHQGRAEEFLKIYSGRRYLRADALLKDYLAERRVLDYRFFLQRLSRDLAEGVDAPPSPFGWPTNAQRTTPLSKPVNGSALPRVINTQATISRQNTVSATVFHGVRSGGEPRWTTMWTLLGEPAFSVAVPCWVTATEPSPVLHGAKSSPLAAAVWRVREVNYDSAHTLKTRWLGQIWNQTFQTENQIIQRTAERLSRWRKEPARPKPQDVARFHHEMARAAMHTMLDLQTRFRNQPAIAEKPSIATPTTVAGTNALPSIMGE